MAMADLWVKVTQWLTTLDSKKLVIFLLSAIVTIILYDQYLLREDNKHLKQENGRLNSVITTGRDRSDSLVSVANRRVQECTEARMQDIQNTTKYWQQRFENLEQRLHEEYRTVKKSKRRVK